MDYLTAVAFLLLRSLECVPYIRPEQDDAALLCGKHQFCTSVTDIAWYFIILHDDGVFFLSVPKLGMFRRKKVEMFVSAIRQDC